MARAMAQDTKSDATLVEKSWRLMVIWECTIGNETAVIDSVNDFLCGSGG
jgi:G:T-mismatch repair DNA endonuclease (very short patch repair protein)